MTTVGIIGLGLIGGSLGRALLSKTDYVVYGRDVDENTMLKARITRAITDELTDERLGEVDVLVFAVNPRIAIASLEKVCPLLKDGATVTDCCGNKRNVVKKMEEMHVSYPKLGFVGAHPMAGREFSGIDHSTPKLFEHAFTVLVPVHSGIEDFMRVKAMFLAAGCDGVQLATAEEHDEMIAYTSQLAHVLSSSYVKNPLSASHAGYSAGSFRDLTRVAKLDATMWTELFCDNADFLCGQIQDVIDRLTEYRDAIREKDEQTLKRLLEEGTQRKKDAENALKEKRKENV